MIDIKEIIKKYPKGAKVNYDEVMKKCLLGWETIQQKPKLLIHSCCAPCSTHVLETLCNRADVTIFFSNSNIHPRNEYLRRALVQKQFIVDFNENTGFTVGYIEDEYKPELFIKKVMENKLEDALEGGERCSFCFEMRLDAVATKAKALNYDYFGTAITLSPYKNSELINTIGFEVSVMYDTSYLPSDFKKKGGYQNSIQMCKEYDIYRQCYCGCIYSAKEHDIDFVSLNTQSLQWVNEYYMEYPKEEE